MVYDVIVLGGGLAGTQAANILHESGLKVLLIEARDRLGGRTESLQFEGYWFDLGGQWVGGTHDILRSVLKKYNISTFPQVDDGKHVLEINGSKQYYSGNISTLNQTDLSGLYRTIDTIDRLSESIDTNHPERATRAKEWDRQTVAEWLNINTPEKESRAIVEWFVRVCLAAEPHEVSMLYFLLFIRQAGKYALLADIHGGAQQDRIIGGSQQVSERLADCLKNSNNLKLSEPVHSIINEKDYVVVKTHKGIYSARYVIVAIPPALASRISYTPPLPSKRDELTQRMFMGSVLKTVILYDEPFWRKDGFSAEAISDKGPIFICYDDSSHDDKKYAIVGFIAGSAARYWGLKPAEERKRAVLECYARWWGPKALTPKLYLEKDWKQEEFSRGCYVGVTGPGTLTEVGDTIRTPVGRIHWAGTETATKWIAYMEGALESGIRAAGEVQSRLKNEKTSLRAKL